jgi:hypothetical protein
MKSLFLVTLIRVMTFIFMATSILLPHTDFGKRIGFVSLLFGLFLWLAAAFFYYILVRIIKQWGVSKSLNDGC